MKYFLLSLVLLTAFESADASSFRRKRAKEGFMGAPSRNPVHHRNRKDVAMDIAGGVVSGAGNAVIHELKRRRTHDNSSY